jgi:hypothetical protein
MLGAFSLDVLCFFFSPSFLCPTSAALHVMLGGFAARQRDFMQNTAPLSKRAERKEIHK